MTRALALSLVAILAIVGCNSEPEPEPEPVEEEPPEPTADEIFNELYGTVKVLWRPFDGPPLDEQTVDQAEQELKSAYSKHKQQDHEHLGDAVDQLRRRLEDLISKADDTGRYLVVKGGIKAYYALTPGSTRYDKLDHRADVLLARPRVKVVGFTTVEDDTFILFRVRDTETDEVTMEKVRVGEKFQNYPIRVEEIIGANQRVRLNYLPINEDWVKATPKTR
ncbi:MAG: hypothetical protein ACLFTT_04595 [Candidatus Hydrogenedentota bacterium]